MSGSPLAFAPVLVALLASPGLASWTLPPLNVSADSAASVTETDGGRNVLAVDGLVFVVWSDTRDGNEEIYFRENLGAGWLPAARVTSNAAPSRHPAIGRPDEGDLRIVWEDHRSGRPEIWTKRKILGIWTADSCLTCDGFDSMRPAIDQRGQHVAWEETKDGNREIYVRRRLLDGSWEPEVRLSSDPGESGHPAVSADRALFPDELNTVAAVAWQDDRNGNWEIYAADRSNLGVWTADQRVTNDPGSSVHPSVISEWDHCGDVIFPIHRIAWQDDATGSDQIWLAEGGTGWWQTLGPVTTSSAPKRCPTIATALRFLLGPFGAGLCATPVVAWEETGTGGSGSIRLLDLTDAAGPVTLSQADSDAGEPVLSIENSFVTASSLELRYELVWTDRRDGNTEVYETGQVLVIDATDAPEVSPGAIGLRVSAAAPNPFRAVTRVHVTLPRAGELRARVVDAAGRTLRRLAGGPREAGVHEIAWDGRTAGGRPAAAGMYFVVVESDATRHARPVSLVR